MRIRVTFSKSGSMRYTGHLDLQRSWERTFRRAHLPLAYSKGFHPQPRINLACALPLGFTSQCELLDAWLDSPLPLDAIISSLTHSIPPGIEILNIEEVSQPLPALQTQVIASDFIITILDTIAELNHRIENLKSRSSLPRVRREKIYDLRPLIEAIEILPPDIENHQRIYLRLSAREAATGRPEEVLRVLDIPIEGTRIHRTKLILSDI